MPENPIDAVILEDKPGYIKPLQDSIFPELRKGVRIVIVRTRQELRDIFGECGPDTLLFLDNEVPPNTMEEKPEPLFTKIALEVRDKIPQAKIFCTMGIAFDWKIIEQFCQENGMTFLGKEHLASKLIELYGD